MELEVFRGRGVGKALAERDMRPLDGTEMMERTE